jgi:hypothetical protein
MDLNSPIQIAGAFIATVLLAISAFKGGVRLGKWKREQPDQEPQLPVRVMVASIMSMLAFILGFTFGLASSHFDSRNKSVFDEAIAIGTAYRRADFLPEPERTNVRDLLMQYLDLRLSVTRSADKNAMIAQLRRLQEQIWEEAALIGKKDPGPPSSAPLVQLLIDVIDVHAEHVLADMRSRIPARVWIILFLIMGTALASAGYLFGLAGARRSFAAIAYALIFAAVIVMTAAQDIPGSDQSRMSHQTLRELRDRLATP